MEPKTAAKFPVIIAAGLFLALILSETCLAQNFEQEYSLLGEQTTYRLNLSITPSLYEYYQQKNHQLTQSNFASFVTPYSLAPVATDIRSIFPEEEDFVNAVLMLVHQIPYQLVEPTKYPVETIVENQGDCDLLSYVASSLIKSQGLNVVLFYYQQESHMNIGVSLSDPPREARSTITFVDYEGTRYYTAECTGGDWRNGWKVGECPQELKDAQLTVITLENCELTAPGQVSSSFGTLRSSFISLTIPSSIVIEESLVLVKGQVSVSNPKGNVTLYAAANNDWFTIGTAELDSDGQYTFPWRPTVWGRYYIKASWFGDDEYAGADSEIATMFIVPEILVIAAAGLTIVSIIAVTVFLLYRTTHPPESHDFAEVA